MSEKQKEGSFMTVVDLITYWCQCQKKKKKKKNIHTQLFNLCKNGFQQQTFGQVN